MRNHLFQAPGTCRGVQHRIFTSAEVKKGEIDIVKLLIGKPRHLFQKGTEVPGGKYGKIICLPVHRYISMNYP